MTESNAAFSAREQSVRQYFQMWLRHDCTGIDAVFAEDAVYIESDGKRYHGAAQLVRWFGEWHEHGTVEQWDITSISHSGSRSFVEWSFVCVYDGNRSGFEGVTIADFNADGRIALLKEFAAAQGSVPVYGD